MNAFEGNRDRQRGVRGATLSNEMGILEREGRSMWHLVGVGLLTLLFEPSDRRHRQVR